MMEHSSKLMNRAADNIRVLVASMVEKAKSGHPGGAMGGADFINVLLEMSRPLLLRSGPYVADALQHSYAL